MTVGLDKAISQLDAAAALAGTELIECVQAGDNVKTTPGAIKTYIAPAAPTGEGQNDGLLSHQDKAKLDGIEAGATADQTAQEIATLIDADVTAETTLKSALGLGSAAYADTGDFATAAQGSTADSALQPGDVDDTPADGATTAPISSNWAHDHAGASNPHGTTLADVSDYVQDKAQQILHGFADRTSSTLSFDDATKTLSLTCNNTAIYLNGVLYTHTGVLQVSLGDTPDHGPHYVTIAAPGGVLTLSVSTSVWSITNTSYTPVATIYWSDTAAAVGDERHGAQRDLQLHRYLHLTVGARIPNDGSFAQTRPSIANDGQIELAAGTLWDEDINNAISTAQGKLCRLWYETASNHWTFTDGTDNGGYDRPYLWNAGTSRVQFPESDNSYTLADGANNNFIPVWVYASNDISRPIYVVTPSLAAAYSTLANARLSTAPPIPFAEELKLLFRWIFNGSGQYQESADYRTSSSLPSGGVSSPVAASVSFTPSGTLAAINVQAALEEVDAEKLAISAIDDTPVSGETTAPISSNWAYDQAVALATEMDGRVLYDEELTRAVAYATDLAGQAARSLPLKQDKAANLTAVAALAVTDGNFIVGNGSTFVAESGATARASLGLGDSATKNVGTTAGTVAAGDTLATETDHRVLYDEELTRAVAYATDLAGQAVRELAEIKAWIAAH